jgi:hypothetical protein
MFRRAFSAIIGYFVSRCPKYRVRVTYADGSRRDPPVFRVPTESFHDRVPLIEFAREPVIDSYDLNRYLNVLHETDRHIGDRFGDPLGTTTNNRCSTSTPTFSAHRGPSNGTCRTAR